MNTKAIVTFIFSKETNVTVNPNFGNDITVAEALNAGYLNVTHYQEDMFTKETRVMPSPSFNVTNFTGQLLFVQLTFPNISLLSLSILDKVDTVTFLFNNTAIFVSTDSAIPSDQKWSFRA
jgi:hypothetical protein